MRGSTGRLGWKTAAVIVVLAVLAVSVISYAIILMSSAGSPVHGDTTAQQTTCMTTFPGQPLGASLRIINATTLEPVAGAIVVATSPVLGLCGASTQTMGSMQFTTNSTEWYSLPFINRGTYQITVTYLRGSYSMTMPLGLSVYNCATLSLPSGQTNVTTTGSAQAPCQSALG